MGPAEPKQLYLRILELKLSCPLPPHTPFSFVTQQSFAILPVNAQLLTLPPPLEEVASNWTWQGVELQWLYMHTGG